MRITSCILSFLIHCLILVFSLYSPFAGRGAYIDLDKPVYEVELVRLPERKAQPAAEELPAQAAERPKSVPVPKKQVQSKIPKAPPPVKIAQKEKKKAVALKKKDTKRKKSPEKKKVSKTQSQPTPDKVLASALAEIKKHANSTKPQASDPLAEALSDIKQDLKKRPQGQTAGAASTPTEAIYGRIVETMIKENWRFPGIDDTKPLQAEVEVEISPSGEITKTTILDSSGRADFDRSVEKAIAETQTLPKPLNARLQKIVITFYSQEL